MTSIAATGGRIYFSPFRRREQDAACFDVHGALGGIACVNLTREQGAALRDALDAWLEPDGVSPGVPTEARRVHLLDALDSPTAGCCGASVAFLDSAEVTLDPAARTCPGIHHKAPASTVPSPASQVTTDAGASEQSAAPVARDPSSGTMIACPCGQPKSAGFCLAPDVCTTGTDPDTIGELVQP